MGRRDPCERQFETISEISRVTSAWSERSLTYNTDLKSHLKRKHRKSERWCRRSAGCEIVQTLTVGPRPVGPQSSNQCHDLVLKFSYFNRVTRVTRPGRVTRLKNVYLSTRYDIGSKKLA